LSQAILDGDLLPMPQAQNEGQKISILGTLVVDIDYEFDNSVISSVIRMSQGSSIKINPNINLNIYDTEIYSCGDKWDNIIVDNGSSLIVGRTTIKDATTAIELLKWLFIDSFQRCI